MDLYFQFEGQVSVFNYVNSKGERGPNYRDLYPTPPPPGLVPSCAEGGVLGVSARNHRKSAGTGSDQSNYRNRRTTVWQILHFRCVEF